MDSNKTTKPLMIKFVSLSSDMDVIPVTIKNFLIHTYYQMYILPFS